MKNKTVKALAIAMTVATVTMMGSASIYASDDTAETATEETAGTTRTRDIEKINQQQQFGRCGSIGKSCCVQRTKINADTALKSCATSAVNGRCRDFDAGDLHFRRR